jgi:hypothetical protein
MAWITEARNVFDEVIVLLDQKRATPGTVARAEKVASRVVRNNGDTWYDPDRFSLIAGCNADWIFIFDYDEQLSAEWRQDGWRRILEKTDLTHFWFPRRWIVPGQRYISCDPWRSDFQMRLFRNNLEGTFFPLQLHDPIFVPGRGASFSNLAIYHHVLWLLPRKMREEKERHYERLRPDRALGFYYLYEDYAVPEAPLPAPAVLDFSRELISMEGLLLEEAAKISLEVSGVPPAVNASAMFWLHARIINGLDRSLNAVVPHPIRLAYHWIQKNTRQNVVFEGLRSGLCPGLDAGATAQYAMAILAPDQPGEYILQTSMVQEGICWFEDVRSDIMQEFSISILP